LKLKKSKNVKSPPETGIMQEISLIIVLGISRYKKIGYYDRNRTVNQVEKKNDEGRKEIPF